MRGNDACDVMYPFWLELPHERSFAHLMEPETGGMLTHASARTR